MQSKLDGTVGKRSLPDRPEPSAPLSGNFGVKTGPRIRNGLGELSMIWQIEEICRESQARLLANGKYKILLQREIEIVNTGVPYI